MLVRLCLIASVGVLLIAQDKEAVLGSHLAGEIRKSTAALDDATVQDYVQQLGLRLADQPGGRDWQWQFLVIREDVGGSTHEPLSIPGGQIFVPAPLILAVGSEAELAGMLAHSMAHVMRRHVMKGNDGASLVFMGAWMGDRTALPVAFVKAQRVNERDADRVAVEMMAAMGYDAAALVSYLRRVPAEDRVSALEIAAANARFRRSQLVSDFQAIQDRVRALIGPSKRPLPTLRRNGGQ